MKKDQMLHRLVDGKWVLFGLELQDVHIQQEPKLPGLLFTYVHSSGAEMKIFTSFSRSDNAFFLNEMTDSVSAFSALTMFSKSFTPENEMSEKQLKKAGKIFKLELLFLYGEFFKQKISPEITIKDIHSEHSNFIHNLSVSFNIFGKDYSIDFMSTSLSEVNLWKSEHKNFETCLLQNLEKNNIVFPKGDPLKKINQIKNTLFSLFSDCVENK